MKGYIDYYDIEKIITEFRDKHIESFCEYRYQHPLNRHDKTIDDVICEAQTTKELEVILDRIKKIVPSYADLEPVHNAVVKLSKHGSMTKNKMIALDKDEYDKLIKIIADYLGVDLDAENADDEE